MTGRIRLTPLARADIDAALTWYGQRSMSAAEGFAAAVDEILERIERAPEHGPVVEDNVRRRNLRPPYPYAAWYTVEADGVLVVGVLHHRQRPGIASGRKPGP